MWRSVCCDPRFHLARPSPRAPSDTTHPSACYGSHVCYGRFVRVSWDGLDGQMGACTAPGCGFKSTHSVVFTCTLTTTALRVRFAMHKAQCLLQQVCVWRRPSLNMCANISAGLHCASLVCMPSESQLHCDTSCPCNVKQEPWIALLRAVGPAFGTVSRPVSAASQPCRGAGVHTDVTPVGGQARKGNVMWFTRATW